MSKQHWSDHLVAGIDATGGTVEIPVADPAAEGGMTVVARRIRGLHEALKHGRAGLREDDTEDLLYLADHLHRVINVLVAAEDELLVELRDRKVPSRTIAGRWGTNHRAVLRREARVLAAYEQGKNPAAFSEASDEDLDMRTAPEETPGR